MNIKNYNILLRSDEKNNPSNPKNINNSNSKITNFKQNNFKSKNYEDDEKKNLNELSAKNNLFQPFPINTSIFNM